jgi:serine/threonine-protein kinase RsbW
MTDESSLTQLGACDAPASMDSWELLNGFVENQAANLLDSSKGAYQVRLACEELFSNIIRHSSGNHDLSKTSHIWLRAFRQEAIEDNGIHFDPDFADERQIELNQPIEQRQVGGLGLFLVQKSVDRVEYAWINDRNRYRLFVFTADEPKSPVLDPLQIEP